jgi:L-ribulokinase
MAELTVRRDRNDPDFATQSHDEHMRALVSAMRTALASSSLSGEVVESIAVDTTGSSVVPVGEGLVPLDDYRLWCDHRAKDEAARITEVAHGMKIPAIDWCGGIYSSEWGFAKLLHWLRHNPDKRALFVTALEHCDMAAAVLCGITDARSVPRSICAMGHKWLWNDSLGGFPPEEFFVAVDPLLAGIREKLGGCYRTSDVVAGTLCAGWASQLGLREGIPVPVGAFDAHWDAIGAGVAEGDIVNVIGTSTCIIAIAGSTGLVPGVCGVVKGSVHPAYMGIEAGLSACGYIFESIATRSGQSVNDLSNALVSHRGGESGLLRLPPSGSASNMALIAAMPDENALPVAAPSSDATASSNAFRVGLASRMYARPDGYEPSTARSNVVLECRGMLTARVAGSMVRPA